MKNKETTKR